MHALIRRLAFTTILSETLFLGAFVFTAIILISLFAPAQASACVAPNAFDGSMWAGHGCGDRVVKLGHPKHKRSYVNIRTTHSSIGARPRRWCGWYMRTQFGGGPEYNLASNWRHRGVSSSAHVGAVVVWPHHVGVIVGQTSSGQWIVKSGNDGGAVRERARSVKGAVFRAGV